MARLSRDSRLETREARQRLAIAHEPYWKLLCPGIFIGYRKGPKGGVWIARVSGKAIGKEAGYLKKAMGAADDSADANGMDILTFKQAFDAALAFAEDLKATGKGANKPVHKFTVQDAVDAYLAEHYAKEGRSLSRTLDMYRTHILPALGGKIVADLTTTEINKWLLSLATAPKRYRGGHLVAFDKQDKDAVRQRKASANRILTQLKACLNHAYKTGRVKSDEAWRKIKPFGRADAPKIRYLSADESRRLLNACNEEFRPLVRAALLTGCRYGELIRLKVSDYDGDNGSVHIADPKGKPRHVPLADEGRRWFDQWTAGKSGNDLILSRANGSPWGRSHQTRPMMEACAAANIVPAVSFHILRHCYGSALATAGVPMAMIAECLGHADGRMTQRHYAHLAPSAVAAMIRQHLPEYGGPDSTVTPLRRKATSQADDLSRVG